MKSSVASVTFRERPPAEVARLAKAAGLTAIEWGGDVHVPPGDREAAMAARAETQRHGLLVSAYGSYYRAGEQEDFSAVLDTALLLGTRVIRVWAGDTGSAACGAEARRKLEKTLAAAVKLAAARDCVVATEYHANTLTDTAASTRDLLHAVPGLRTLWQPPVGIQMAENLWAMRVLGDGMENLHVYHRDLLGNCRPLQEGAEAWRRYFSAVPKRAMPRYATLEFVMGGGEEQFLADAETLHQLLREGLA